MSVEPHLLSTHSEAIIDSMQAERTVTRIAFNPSVANPGDILYVAVPKLAKDVVMVPGSLALVFDIDLAGGHANNYLVQNVSRALVSRLTVTFGGTSVQDTNGYDIYKIFDDLFLSVYERDEMLMEGSRVRSCARFAPIVATTHLWGGCRKQAGNGLQTEIQNHILTTRF